MANPVLDMIAARRGPRLAIEFRAEEIALFALDEGGEWKELSAFRVDAPDFAEQVAQMRRRAIKGGGAKVPRADIWLPRDQVANAEIKPDGLPPAEAAIAAFTEGKALDPHELIIDVAAHSEGHAASAAESRVVEEARDYVSRWGFSPQRVTTRHGHAAFPTGPTFARPKNKGLPVLAGAGLAAALLVAGLSWLALTSEDPSAIPAGPNPVAEQVKPSAGVVAAQDASEQADARRTVEAAAPEPGPEAEAEAEAESPETAPAPAVQETSPAPVLVVAQPGAVVAAGPPLEDVIVADPLAPASPLRAHDAPSEPFAGRPAAPAVEQMEDAPKALLIAAGALSEIAPEDAPPPPLSADAAMTLASLGDAPTAPAARVAEPEAEDGDVDPPEIERRELSVTNDPRRPEPVEEEEDVYAPGPGSVASSPPPAPRPDALDMTPSNLAVAAAPAPSPRPASIRPRAPDPAATSGDVRTVSRPQRGPPAGPGVANAATLKDAIELERMNLIGVFGSGANRRALLRLANGDVMRVTKGTVVEGWTISRIDKASMRITKGGQSQTLNVVR